MEERKEKGAEDNGGDVEFYCAKCARGVDRPLVCGDCTAVICRECGTVLERVDELGLG